MSIEKNLERIIDSMPSLPVTVVKILEITKDPASTPNDLNQVISLDPVLTGKVLKLVNSAYYNVSNQVTSIVKAIIMLGLNTIKNLAISTAVLGTIQKNEKFVALNPEGYWRHSLAVGVTAKYIAQKMNVDRKLQDEYFIGGLLHDIGKIPINEHFDQLYLQVVHEADLSRTPLWRKERERMEVDHAAVGAMIARKWELTGAIAEAIAFHHEPLSAGPDARRVVFAVAAANSFCVQNDFGFAGDRRPDPLPPEVWQGLRLTEEDLFDVEKVIEAEIEKASIFLRIAERGA